MHVPEHRDVPAFVLGVYFEVEVLDVLSAVEGIGVRTREGVGGGEWLAARRHDSHPFVDSLVSVWVEQVIVRGDAPMKSFRPLILRTIRVRGA